MTRTTYTEGSYTLTQADFDGCLICTDAVTGRQTATGPCPRGDVVTAPLNVPICIGCDKEIVGGRCDDCEIVFEEQWAGVHGDPLLNRRVAA